MQGNVLTGYKVSGVDIWGGGIILPSAATIKFLLMSPLTSLK